MKGKKMQLIQALQLYGRYCEIYGSKDQQIWISSCELKRGEDNDRAGYWQLLKAQGEEVKEDAHRKINDYKKKFLEILEQL